MSPADLSVHERYTQASASLSRSPVPPCDLAVVLEQLKGPLFEPLQGADLKFVSLKAVLLWLLRSESVTFMRCRFTCHSSSFFQA